VHVHLALESADVQLEGAVDVFAVVHQLVRPVGAVSCAAVVEDPASGVIVPPVGEVGVPVAAGQLHGDRHFQPKGLQQVTAELEVLHLEFGGPPSGNVSFAPELDIDLVVLVDHGVNLEPGLRGDRRNPDGVGAEVEVTEPHEIALDNRRIREHGDAQGDKGQHEKKYPSLFHESCLLQ